MKLRNMMMMISILLLLLLSGCWGKTELEQRGFVVVIGLDKNEGHLIDVTFQLANPQVGSTDIAAAEKEPASGIVTFTAPDLAAAKELANMNTAKEITFGQLRTIIVGEELAKTEEFNHIISTALVNPEIRTANNIIVTKEKASTFIKKNKTEMVTRPHKYYSFMLQEWESTGYVPVSNLNSYFQQVEGQLFLSVYATTNKDEEEVRKNESAYEAGQIPQHAGNPVQMMGSAILKKGKMIGTLNGAETRTALLLRRSTISKNYIQSFPDPINEAFRIVVQIKRGSGMEVQMKLTSDIPEIDVTVPIKIQVTSNPGLENYSTNLSNQNKLKHSIEDDLKKEAMELINKTQEEYEGEPFEWYLEARRQFWTLDEYDNYEWSEKYKDANVKVNFDVTIENLGAQIKPESIKK